MSAASLSLLTGGKKDLGEKEPEAVVLAKDVDVQVDIDGMNMAQIDALVLEHKIATPGNWKKCSLTAKVKWLKDNLPSTAEEQPEAPSEEPSGTEQELTAAHAILAGKAEQAQPYLPGVAEVVDELAKIVDEQVAGAPEAVDNTIGAIAEKTGGLPIEATAKGKKGKGNALVKSESKTGEILDKDPIHDIIHEIENLNEKGVYAIIEALKDQSAISFFKLGGVLSLAQANSWFDGYANLKEFAEKKYGIEYRNATYWVSIYNNLADSKVPWEKVKGIGWTKLKEIAKILTVENADEWVVIATENNTLQLGEIVKAHKKKNSGALLEADDEAKTVTTKTFKMHDGQRQVIEAAIEKAREAAGTKVDTVALEIISQEYLASPTMLSRVKSLGLEAAAELLEQAFPLAHITIELVDSPDDKAA